MIGEFEDIISIKSYRNVKTPTNRSFPAETKHGVCENLSNVRIKRSISINSKFSTSNTGLPQYSTNNFAQFWDRDKIIGVAGIAFLFLMIFYGMSDKENTQTSASKQTPVTSSTKAPTQTSSSLTASSIMEYLSFHRWAVNPETCKKYFRFSKSQDGSYSINFFDLDNTSNNIYEPIRGAILEVNYRLDSGAIIPNVIKIETPIAFLDIAYNSAVPEFRLYRLEYKSGNLEITQGRRLDNGNATPTHKKCS